MQQITLHSFDALTTAMPAVAQMARESTIRKQAQFIRGVIRSSVDLIIQGRIQERNSLDRWVMMCARGNPVAYAEVRRHPDFVVAVFLVSGHAMEASTCRAHS